MAQKKIVKHFPSDTNVTEKYGRTFLTNKKVDAELYALLMQYSFGEKDKETQKGITRVDKKSLPTQVKMCEMLRIKSRATLNTHLKNLISEGYLIDKGDYYMIDQYKESIYLEIEQDTIDFLNNTVRESVWKAYIYLGQRWKWKKSDFVFTLEDLGKHIGKPINNNQRVYAELNHILICLQNNGLIKVAEFYDGKYPKKRLVDFSFSYKRMD